MKQYEKNLKKLISVCGGGSRIVRAPSTGISDSELRFLSAKGLISLSPAGNNAFYIRLEKPGLTYFSDKQEARSAFLREHLFTFLGGVLSGFISGVLVTLATQYLTR